MNFKYLWQELISNFRNMSLYVKFYKSCLTKKMLNCEHVFIDE